MPEISKETLKTCLWLLDGLPQRGHPVAEARLTRAYSEIERALLDPPLNRPWKAGSTHVVKTTEG